MSWLDNLSFECTFLQTLFDITKYKEYLGKNSINFHFCTKSYCYLIELSINNLILAIEYLIDDSKISEYVTWGGQVTTKDVTKKIKSQSKDIEFISGLESFRDKIQNSRLSNRIINMDLLDNLGKKISEVRNYYFQTLKYSTNTNVKKEAMYLFYIANSKPYLNGDINTETGEMEFSSPADYSYHLMPYQDDEKYSFSNKDVADNEDKYIEGYAITLSYVFEDKIDRDLLDSLRNSKTWKDIHHLGCEIRDNIIEKNELKVFDSIYVVEYKNDDNKENIREINTERDLKIVLRDRKILIQNLDYMDESFLKDNLDEAFPVLYHIMLASVIKGIKSGDKTDLIELKYKKSNGDFSHSYLVYMFQGASLWNASYWLLFKDTALSNDKGYKSNGISRMNELIEEYRDFLNYESHFINPIVFQNYLKKHSKNYARRMYLENSLKDSNSLLNELLHLYIKIKSSKEELIHIDWGHEFENGEIDSIIITKSNIHVIQSKLRFVDIDNVIKHFRDVIKYLPKYCQKNNLDMTARTLVCELILYDDIYLDDDEKNRLKKNNIQINTFKDITKGMTDLLDDRMIEKIKNTIII
jgi:hypothetical protein